VTLFELATQVLADVVAVWAAESVDLPALRYVSAGPFEAPAYDCAQVVVTVDVAQVGNPNSPIGTRVLAAPWSAGVSVQIVRDCMPLSKGTRPPTAAEQTAAAEIVLADMEVMRRHAAEIVGGSRCKPVGVTTVVPLLIQGAVGGSRLSASVDISAAP
jgi:hypothetical protein